MEVRQHRLKNYWDVIYDPQINLSQFAEIDLNDVNRNIGHRYRLFDFSKLNDSNSISCKLDKHNFLECDFFGESKGNKINFSNCKFEKVYFGYGLFKNVKFQKCDFIKCSFNMAKFIDCQFIDCRFDDISFSGNETIFQNTLINSKRIVSAAFLNVDEDVLKQYATTVDYQKKRFENTKAKFAKNLLVSVSSTTDDDLYYNAVKTYLISRSKAKIEKFQYGAKEADKGRIRKISYQVRAITSITELLILRVSGLINDWGNSILRALIIGVAMIFIFAIGYYFLMDTSVVGAIIKSIDITLLAGYTKHVTKLTPVHQQIVMLFNMILGLWWYAIMIPTLINRICVSRQ